MKILLCVPVVAAVLALACPPPAPPPAPPNGFLVQTQIQEFVNGIPTTPPLLLPFVGLHTQFYFASQPTIGTLTTCTGVTDGLAHLNCPDRRVPAVWEFIFTSGPCFGIGNVNNVDIPPGGLVGFRCELFFGRFSLSHSSMDVGSPPPTFTLTGDGMSSTYGMPVLKFVNTETGEIEATVTATSLNPEGTWLQAPTPFLGFMYSGQYVVVVQNVKSDGSLEGLGGDWLEIYGNDPPPPPPPPCPAPQPDEPAMPCEGVY